MPDFNIETAFTCATNIMWGPIKMKSAKSGNTYHVSWGRLFGANRTAQFGWICTCRGYQIRGTCSHCKAVEKSGRRCGWNEELEPTYEPDTNERGERCCPDCGGEVHPMRVAV